MLKVFIDDFRDQVGKAVPTALGYEVEIFNSKDIYVLRAYDDGESFKVFKKASEKVYKIVGYGGVNEDLICFDLDYKNYAYIDLENQCSPLVLVDEIGGDNAA